MAPGYVYAGVTNPPRLISWFVQAPFTLDIDGDGKLDMVAPMNKGYSSGIDTRTPFIALTSVSGLLEFNPAINAKMPVTAGARRQDSIHLLASDSNGVITVAHDTGDRKYADLTVLTDGLTGPSLSGYMPKLPTALPSRDFTVNAHSMAVGDINGDDIDDVLVGDWGSWSAPSNGMYSLIQQADGVFKISYQGTFKTITNNWPLMNPSAGEKLNLLIDLHLVDVNSDGYDDLITGWGHGSTHSYIFINTLGTFSVEKKIALPDSIYGIDNQLHLKTFDLDFNNDGKTDLAVLWSRYNPFYGGNYIQLLQNDGLGNFTDVTSTRIDKPAQDAMGMRLQWTDHWQLLDVNGDGAIDIVGQRTGDSSAPVVYLNDGNGNFKVTEVFTGSVDIGRVIQWADLDQDGAIELVSFKSRWTDAAGTSSQNKFNVFKLNGEALLSAHSNSLKMGTAIDDVLVGTGKNDMLIGKGGNDIINGATGIDTAQYSGLRLAYDLVNIHNGVRISAKLGEEGIDKLYDIERLQFTDKNIALDLAPTQAAGQTALLIGAVLPGQLVYDVSKQALLGSVIGLFDQGFTLNQLSGALLRLPVWDVLTGKAVPTNADIASYLVNNVYEGKQTTAITNAAIAAMNAETPTTQGTYLASLAASTANQTHVDLVGVQTTGLVYGG